MRHSQQDHKEVVKQLKDATNNLTTSTKIIFDILIEKDNGNDFQKNAAALENTGAEEIDVEDTVSLLQKTVSLKKLLLQKCCNKRFKRLCNSMQTNLLYEYERRSTYCIKITLEKKWIKPKLKIDTLIQLQENNHHCVCLLYTSPSPRDS